MSKDLNHMGVWGKHTPGRGTKEGRGPRVGAATWLRAREEEDGLEVGQNTWCRLSRPCKDFGFYSE